MPSSLKYRSAVNCAFIRFTQKELVGGVGDLSTLLALGQVPTQVSLAVVRCGPKPWSGAGQSRGQVRAKVVTDDRDPGIGRVEGAQVPAEFQEPSPGLARLDVPEQLALAQLIGAERIPDPGGPGVGRARGRGLAAGFFALAADRGPLPAGPGLQVDLTWLNSVRKSAGAVDGVEDLAAVVGEGLTLAVLSR